MNKELRIRMYKDMLRLRRFEEHVKELFAIGKIPGFVHLYLGEEAIAVGACTAVHGDDYLTSTHRGHGHVLAKGADPGKMFAELFGKKTGYNKAKGGSMHLASPELGILGANGIVGGGIPIATGAAMTAKKMNNGRVALCFFGDAGASQGTFHEAVNIAASYKLPCIYICENNLYGGGVKQHFDGVFRNEGMDYPRSIENIGDRAASYDIPGMIVDGNNVEEVYNAVKKAADRARKGDGPSLIECKTYRWQTHFEGEPDTYRDPDEVSQWLDKCPLKTYQNYLLNKKYISQSELDKIAEEVELEMDVAIKFADESPLPATQDALLDVYA